jgi:hypothetical protein
MFGIISQDNIDQVGHSLFNNFRLALTNYLHTNFKDVLSVEDLSDIQVLFIIDEHYIPHKNIWLNDTFIDCINSRNIKTIIFNFEKIFNSQFPWNEAIQQGVEKIKNRIQLVSDIKDAERLNTNIINKQLLSKDTILPSIKLDKEDTIVFIGQINEYYPTRGSILNEIKNSHSNVNIIKTDRKYTYEEFINIVNSSKFILNPLGTGEFINLRFYEALKLGCIVIQQYTDDMLGWYEELNNKNVLLFKDINDFNNLNFEVEYVENNEYLEDYFAKINLNMYL